MSPLWIHRHVAIHRMLQLQDVDHSYWNRARDIASLEPGQVFFDLFFFVHTICGDTTIVVIIIITTTTTITIMFPCILFCRAPPRFQSFSFV